MHKKKNSFVIISNNECLRNKNTTNASLEMGVQEKKVLIYIKIVAKEAAMLHNQLQLKPPKPPIIQHSR